MLTLCSSTWVGLRHSSECQMQQPPRPHSQQNSHPAETLSIDPTSPYTLELNTALTLLGGAVRLQLLRLLASGPRCVGDAAESLGIGLSLASHNLRKLEEAGLVVATRRERRRIYSLDGTIASTGPNGLHLEVPLPQGWSLTMECPFRTQNWPPVQIDPARTQSMLDQPAPRGNPRPGGTHRIQTED